MKDRSHRASTPERPEQNVIPESDPYASPLGRGADPGAAGGDTSPLPSGGASIAGQRGHNMPNARGGPEGFASRENEDMMQHARDAPRQGYDASGNEAAD